MRRILVAASTAALLALSASAALAIGPPDGRGEPAQDQCEEQKGKAQNPDNGDCDY